MAVWPKDTQDARNAFYGDPATGLIAAQMVDVVPPFAMYYEGKRIKTIKFHKKAAPALLAALNEIWDYCQHDQAKVDSYGLSKYDGAYNPRYVRGSTTKWSNHAYACAIDINAAENGFNTGHGTMPQFAVDAFLRQGWMWGGDYAGRTDPMHFEAVDNGGRQPKSPRPVYGGDPVPNPIPPKPDLRTRMGKVIVGYEARRDAQGHLAVYQLPANDGGGTFEVGGINDKYDHDMAVKLRAMVQAGQFGEAEAAAVEYICQNTDGVTKWMPDNPGLVFYGRDCAFNRGATGAIKIAQIALGFTGKDVDGDVGENTRGRLAKIQPGPFLEKLRAARETYEDIVAPGRPNLREGLINRWNKSLVDAKKFLAEVQPGAEIVLPEVKLPPPATPPVAQPTTFLQRLAAMFSPKGVGR